MSEKSVSFRDILRIPRFSGFREMDLLHPSLDESVLPYLYALGIDTRFPLEIDVFLHRDMSNKVDVGYRWCGTMRRDNEFVDSGFCEMIDRVSIAMLQDVSLGLEMCSLMNKTFDYKKASDMSSMSDCRGNDQGLREDLEDFDEDYERNSNLIKMLEEVRDSVRGNADNNNNVKEEN